MPDFSQETIYRFQRYFLEKYEVDLSEDQARQYLGSLLGWFELGLEEW